MGGLLYFTCLLLLSIIEASEQNFNVDIPWKHTKHMCTSIWSVLKEDRRSQPNSDRAIVSGVGPRYNYQIGDTHCQPGHFDSYTIGLCISSSDPCIRLGHAHSRMSIFRSSKNRHPCAHCDQDTPR